MKFFTSDLHFNDAPTLKMDSRPFKTAKQFDNFVIKHWNKVAKKGDTIYVVGDFVDCDGAGYDSWKKSITYVKRVKANIVLVVGNNEERVIKNYFDSDFDKFREYCLGLGYKDVCKNATIKINEIDFYLVHKPTQYNPNMLNLFGHVHRSGGLYKPFGINIGCDLNHFMLFSEDEIMRLLAMKHKFWDVDEGLNMVVENQPWW